jgi:hypothetical protein
MQLKPGSFCPLLKKDCVRLQCSWFTKLEGKDINSGKDVEEWGCAISFLPLLLVENSGQQRQTGAAVESFRNEMVKTNEATQRAMFRQLTSSFPPSPADASRLIRK